MTKKFLLCFLFFVFSPVIIFASFFLGDYLKYGFVLGESDSFQSAGVYSSAGRHESKTVYSSYKIEDSLGIIIEKYLKKYKSPLLPYASVIVSEAEKNNIDPRLIVAISQQESNLGKSSPENCFNAWGWGIHSRGTRCFNSWQEAIEVVTRGIARDYCQKGYCHDPCIMMKKYTPRSNGSWCAGVNQFLAEMETGEF